MKKTDHFEDLGMYIRKYNIKMDIHGVG